MDHGAAEINHGSLAVSACNPRENSIERDQYLTGS
jgi:hypothetical protein